MNLPLGFSTSCLLLQDHYHGARPLKPLYLNIQGFLKLLYQKLAHFLFHYLVVLPHPLLALSKQLQAPLIHQLNQGESVLFHSLVQICELGFNQIFVSFGARVAD